MIERLLTVGSIPKLTMCGCVLGKDILQYFLLELSSPESTNCGGPA